MVQFAAYFRCMLSAVIVCSSCGLQTFRTRIHMSIAEPKLADEKVPLSVVNKGVRIQTTRKALTEKYSATNPSLEPSVLAGAYEQCKKITSIFAKTFYLGTKLMEEDQKTAVWAIYVWCRRTDDLVDGPRALMNPEAMKIWLPGKPDSTKSGADDQRIVWTWRCWTPSEDILPCPYSPSWT